MSRRLVTAGLLPFLALALQWLLWPWISPFVWFLFFPTVFFSARLGGLLGGLASTVLSVIIVWFFFIPPQLSWALDHPSNLYSVGLFLLMGYLVSDAQERLRLAQRHSEASLIETRAANEKITQLYQKTLELDELKTQFFANVSHELRTPLTLIMSPLARRLAAADLPETYRREDEMMLRNAHVLYRQVSDLLDAAKLESGHMRIDYAYIDIGELTRVIASQFDHLAPEKDIDYCVDAPAFLEVEADSEKLQRILINLLSNAFKFVPEGGRIEIRLRKQGDQAVIEVQDNGPGVPFNMQAAVFERFRQVEGGSQRRFGGTGLGLAIVRDFAELHGGAAGLVEAPGGGALFIVRFPVHAPAGAVIQNRASQFAPVMNYHIADEPRPTAPDVALSAGENAPLVLVVEDNADMNTFIANTLRPYYRVACAYNGREGLEQALARHPDLILCDVMMPQLSGDQLVAELRRQPGMIDVPVVMLTAKADDELRVRLLKDGVQDYLSKPFLVEELLARVGGLINERSRTQTELRHFEQIVATSGDMLAFVDSEQRLLVTNPAYAELFGAVPADMRYRQIADIEGSDMSILIAQHLKLALAGESQRVIVEPTFADGKRRVLDAVYRPLWQNGEVQGVVISLRDITELKKAEEALRASAATLKVAQRLAGIGNWEWDIQTDTHTWSEEIYRIYGRDTALPPAVYPEVRQYFTPESWTILAAAVEKGLTEGMLYECDAEVVRPDGAHRWIVARGESTRDAAGKVVELHGTVQDITVRRQAEEALRQGAALYRHTLDNMLEGCQIIGFDWRYHYGNAAADRQNSQPIETLIGRTMMEAYPGLETTEIFATLCRCMEKRIEQHSETEFIFPNGSRRWFDVNVIPAPEGIAIFSVDITERKQAEESIRQLNDDLERRVVERTAALIAANSELDSFAYAVSHDLRAPLRAMSGFSQALIEDYGSQLPGEARVYLDQIDLASRKMNELIDGLLTLSRSVRGELRHDNVDLSALSERLLAELLRNNPGREMDAEVEAGLRVYGDARMLEAVMRNLLGNAWKYTAYAAAPTIRVYAEERQGVRCFCVADNGAGFDMRHSDRLFQPFQRLHRQEEFPGIGIGLATVQRIVHRHNGVMDARGEPGKGAVFCFTLSITSAASIGGEKEA